MYDRDIKNLQWHGLDEFCPADVLGSIDKAIALFKAAEPMSAEAEKAHCKSIADALCNSMDIVTQNYNEWAEVAAAFVAERAELSIVRKDRDDWKARAAAAERERDQMAFERDTYMESAQDHAAAYHTNGVQSLQRQVAELETQLAAVERLLTMQHADSSVQVSALREALGLTVELPGTGQPTQGKCPDCGGRGFLEIPVFMSDPGRTVCIRCRSTGRVAVP